MPALPADRVGHWNQTYKTATANTTFSTTQSAEASATHAKDQRRKSNMYNRATTSPNTRNGSSFDGLGNRLRFFADCTAQ